MFRRSIKFQVDICVEDDDDRFHAYCPSLEGIHVDGETREEAIENAKTAIGLYIKSLIQHNDPIPLQIIRGTEVGPHAFFCPPQKTENVLVTV
ncbi:MAG: type II toxin-antitoxin system HicB family antitoxin [Deltaproteobacteria bacterium]|nr:type II toxin-antitoxin system HicB family antitoxin [Deltaproteobacteria bacterium]